MCVCVVTVFSLLYCCIQYVTVDEAFKLLIYFQQVPSAYTIFGAFWENISYSTTTVIRFKGETVMDFTSFIADRCTLYIFVFISYLFLTIF